MDFYEAAALFELGRRWDRTLYACSPPPHPVEIRKKLIDALKEWMRLLNLPVDKLPDVSRSPKKFTGQASELFANLITAVRVTRGEQASLLVQIGGRYANLVSTKPKSKSAKPDDDDFMEAMKQFGVETKKRNAIRKKVSALRRLEENKDETELQVAQELARLLAATASKVSGIRVGEAVLRNSIVLPNQEHLVLPKRLVGYRDEIEGFLKKNSYGRNVFLMMPFRAATKSLRTKIRAVCARYKLNLVIADENRIVENDLNSNVLACLLASKYGVAVFSRPETQQTVNPNVAYELGMMHRDDKTCLILKDKSLKSLPTDLIGHLYRDYSPRDHQSLESHVETWIQESVL